MNTDSPVVPQEELPYQVAMAIRLGLPEDVALKGVTINPARMLKLEKRLGSLEPGKDADIGVWTGDPFDPRLPHAGGHHRRRRRLRRGEGRDQVLT